MSGGTFFGALYDAAKRGMSCVQCDFCAGWAWRVAPAERSAAGHAFAWCNTRKCERRVSFNLHVMTSGHVLTDAVTP